MTAMQNAAIGSEQAADLEASQAANEPHPKTANAAARGV